MASICLDGEFIMANTDNLTYEKLMEVLASVPRDPLADMMREQGFDPDAGGYLILPIEFQCAAWGLSGPPTYIRFSYLADAAYLVKMPISDAGR